MTILRWACLPSLVLFACDTTAPEHPDAPEPAAHVAEGPADAAAPAPADAASPPPAPPSGRPTIVAVDISLIEVRMQDDADEVEIEIALPRPLAPTGASRPSLQIGDEVTRRSRAGRSGRLDRLIFTVSAEQYARMSPSDDIVVRAGLFSNEASLAKPHLPEAK